MHLLKSVYLVFFLDISRPLRLLLSQQVHVKELSLCFTLKAECGGVCLYKVFELSFDLVYPLHFEQVLECWVLGWIGDVRQSVKGQEFRGFREVRTLCVEELLKVSLLFLHLLLGRRTVLVAGVHHKYHKVDVQVELQLLARKVFVLHLFGDQPIPSSEELSFVSLVETL